MLKVIAKCKKGDITIQAQVTPLFSNCGGEVLSSFGCSIKTDSRDMWGSKIYYPSIEECFEALDSSKESWMGQVGNKGITILSDRISNFTPINLSNDTNLDYGSRFRTRDFARYLELRRVGMIVRGPLVANASHMGGTAITSWIWVKNPNLLIDDTVLIQKATEFGGANNSNISRQYPDLNKSVMAYVDDRINWEKFSISGPIATGQTEGNVGSAGVRRVTKRTDVSEVRRREFQRKNSVSDKNNNARFI